MSLKYFRRLPCSRQT